MFTMGQHSDASEAGARLVRAHRAAWAVFLGMAGTTMSFQVYHAVTSGQMPVPLAWLYGVVPLAISVGVLEFASKWGSAAGQWGAYAVTVGAMYMSAAATGTVTGHAAAPHAALLFGVLLDTAALLAIRFIMSGPKAADAIAAATKRETALREKADEAARELESVRTAMSAQLDAERSARATDVSALQTQLEAAGNARERAQQTASEALARADEIAQRAAAGRARKPRQPAPASAQPSRSSARDGDVTNELRAVMELLDDPSLCRPRMSGELARKLGVSPATGRRLYTKLVKDGALTDYARALAEPLAERSPEIAHERLDERSGERS